MPDVTAVCDERLTGAAIVAILRCMYETCLTVVLLQREVNLDLAEHLCSTKGVGCFGCFCRRIVRVLTMLE
jgi:hypothetical protein